MPDYSKIRAALLELKAQVDAGEAKESVCGFVYDKLYLATEKNAVEYRVETVLFTNLVKSWPEAVHPVYIVPAPDPIGQGITPSNAAAMAYAGVMWEGSFWEGAYGDNRRRLLDWLLKETQNENEEPKESTPA